MRLRIVASDEIIEGTPIELIDAMQARTWGWDRLPRSEFMLWLTEQARDQNARVDVESTSEDHRATLLVVALIEAGLLEPLSISGGLDPDEALALDRLMMRYMRHADDRSHEQAWQALSLDERLRLVFGLIDRQFARHGVNACEILGGDEGLERIEDAVRTLGGVDARVVLRLVEVWWELEPQRHVLAAADPGNPESLRDLWQTVTDHENVLMDTYWERREGIVAALIKRLHET